MKDVRAGLWAPHRIGHCLISDFDRSLQLPEMHAKMIIQQFFHSLLEVVRNCFSSNSASEIRQEHPLNLSILLSGGKEINEDCLSSGE